MKMQRLESKIVQFNVVKPGDTPPPVVLPDINPLEVRIDDRPDGEFDAKSNKITLSTQEGLKKLYYTVSFMRVPGRINGKDVIIERPIEFFIPMGQSTDEDQWITANMRSLSLAACGGYCAKALHAMTKVSWNKGPVKCGKKDYGNNKLVPIIHNSEVAAIGWAIQQTLYRKGFLDCDGNQVPAHKLAELFENRFNPNPNQSESVNEAIQDAIQFEQNSSIKSNEPPRLGGLCGVCKSYSVVMEQGCAICKSCGDSKCG
jgi:ribonucleoside-diphosphate reductase alpha chain